jgi:hypothetical protein
MKPIQPETLRCWDNGGKTADRYTVIPPRWTARDWRERGGLWNCIGASAEPFHPQGFGQHCTATPGGHLGRRVPFASLPPDVRRFALQSFVNP